VHLKSVAFGDGMAVPQLEDRRKTEGRIQEEFPAFSHFWCGGLLKNAGSGKSQPYPGCGCLHRFLIVVLPSFEDHSGNAPVGQVTKKGPLHQFAQPDDKGDRDLLGELPAGQ